MKILWNLTLFLGLFMWIPVTYSHSSPVPEDQDISGDDEESSGSGFAEHESAWVTDVPVMPTDMTTRSSVTISYSPYTSVSQSLLTIYQHVSLKDVVLEETTAVSRIVPKETTTVFQKRLESTEVVDYTSKANFKEDNRPTISIKVTDKNTTVIMTTEGRNSISPVFEDIIMSDDRAGVVNSDMDSDFHFDNDNKSRKAVPVNDPVLAYDASSGNNSLLERKEVLAAVIAGGVVGLMFAIMLISLMVYRLKKKDEGSYALEDHIRSNVGYQKPQKQVEFLA